MDMISAHSDTVRKPLMVLVALAVFMTYRSSRQGINYTNAAYQGNSVSRMMGSKSNGMGTYGMEGCGFRCKLKSKFKNPFAKKDPMSTYMGSGSQYGTAKYGQTNSGYGQTRSSYGQPSYGQSNLRGGTGVGSYGAGAGAGAGQNSFGTNTGSNYGGMNSMNSMNNGRTGGYGATGNNGMSMGMGGTTGTYGSGGGTTMNNNAGFSTSKLVEMHGASGQAQVVQGGIFQDFGSVTSFMGQVETIGNAMDSPNVVQQALSSPGHNKVLIVDGGGSYNGALFDSAMVNSAQSNGWKGIILNGVVRDAEALRNMPFGIKAIGSHPMRGQQSMGQRGTPVTIGGVTFNTGSWVYADKDGIVMSATDISGGMGNSMSTGMNAGGMNSYNNGMNRGGMNTGTGSTFGANTGGMNNNYGSQTSYGNNGMSTGGMNTGMGSSYGTGTNAMGQSSYGGNTGGYGSNTGYGSTGGSSRPYSSTSSYGRGSSPTRSYGGKSTYGSTYGNAYGRKRPNKAKVIGIILFLLAIVWLCLGD